MKISTSPSPAIFDDEGNPMSSKDGIAAIRKKYGYSTETFGAICGVSARTVEGWEQGRPVPLPSLRLIQADVLENWFLNHAFATAKRAGFALNEATDAEKKAFAQEMDEAMGERTVAREVRAAICSAIVNWGKPPRGVTPEPDMLPGPVHGTVQQWINSTHSRVAVPYGPEGEIDIGLVSYDPAAGVFRILMGINQGTYDIAAQRIENAAGFLDFLWQLHRKEWVTAQHIKDFLDCMTCHIHRDHNGAFPQPFFKVTGGMSGR